MSCYDVFISDILLILLRFCLFDILSNWESHVSYPSTCWLWKCDSQKDSGERKDMGRLIMLYYSSCFLSFAFLLLAIGRICYPSDFLEKSLLLFLPVPWNALESHFQKTNSHLYLSVSAFLPFWFGEKIFSFRIFFVFIRLRSAYYRNKSTDIVYMYTRKLYVFFQTGRYKQNACYGIGKILFRMKVENGKW